MIEKFFGSDACVIKKQRIFGGDANDAFLLYLNDGRKIFLKENSIDNADFFRAEAEGVTAIKDTKAVRVPEILGSGADENSSYLLMEYIESSNTSKDYWEKLGTALANMHKADTEDSGKPFTEAISKKWVAFRDMKTGETCTIYTILQII